jgi:cephalosporin-C deacetylase-like acetyl esterase
MIPRSSLAALLLTAGFAQAQGPDVDRQQEFLKFIKAQAAELRAGDKAPATRAEWEKQREEVRRRLQEAWGPFPTKPCPLEPKILGTIQRDGYRVEKLIFQTLPGVWMTANAYVPDKPGKHPALLAVHGHWRGARVDPVVQKRCIGPAKLGFFVLAVDAFGAGERGLGTKLGEYHGEMVAATLLPVGLPLSGLQVYENTRAVDYLMTRPEVDGSRIGITGASGGGNQTVYAGAWDDRFAAVVPVCSVGNYQAYLGTACCMCEVVPGALRFTEEWGVLGLTAPRGLMVVNATKDGIQFSVGESKKSLALVSPIYGLYKKPDHVRHANFEGPHDYSQAMRESMYGWITKHLKGEGDGKPIPDPEMKTEDPETLRCFPNDSRPNDWITLPKFAAAEARKILEQRKVPATAAEWQVEAKRRREALVDKVFGGFPKKTPLGLKVERLKEGSKRTLTFQPEPGLTLTATHLHVAGGEDEVTIVLNLDGAEKAAAAAASLHRFGDSVITLDLRATGKLAWSKDKVGRAPDHNTAEWSLWLGRPLLGQWTWDIIRLLDALEADGSLPKGVAIVGQGSAGVVALCAAALDQRITRVAADHPLASYVSEVPYENQRVGVMAPGILREVGDVQHLAALCAPRRVVISDAVGSNGRRLTVEETRSAFASAVRVWQILGAERKLVLKHQPG